MNWLQKISVKEAGLAGNVKLRQLEKYLRSLGYEPRKSKASHTVYARPGVRQPVSVPNHRTDLRVGTLSHMARDLGIPLQEFLSQLHGV